MKTAALIVAARAAGVTIKVDAERLVLSAPGRPNDRLLEGLRRQKPAIVAYLRDIAAWTEEDWQALFDERAGIMEFDGGLPRGDAEERAKAELQALLRVLATGATDV